MLTDPSVPIQDIEAKLDAGVAGYGRTFGVMGHQASAVLVMPYIWGDISGNVFEEARSVTRSGVGDIKLRLAVNLIGGEAMTPKEFMKRTPRTTLGASLSISAPTGQYDPDKLINLGTNRWAFKPEIGLTIPHGRWMFDAFAGVWLFSCQPGLLWRGASRAGSDADFAGTRELHVSPAAVAGARHHVLLRWRNQREWCCRQTTERKIPASGSRSHCRWGRATRSNSTVSKGATARLGSNFTTYGIGWQHTWFDKQPR